MNALVIGCGNIGALYDFRAEGIKTHCKALSKLQDIAVSVYDEDISLSKKVSAEYGFACIEKINEIKLDQYQWVIIASPTDTHLSWLEKCFASKIPLVVCEKPVAKTLAELSALEKSYNNSQTKITVNYFRRFQPAYIHLKEEISQQDGKPVHIVIKYQRGIINNFSHAADLLSFFFGEYEFENNHITQRVFDEFDDDPTMSFTFGYNGIPVAAIGLSNARYSFFEIEIFFKDRKINLQDGGNRITYYTARPAERFYLPLVAEGAGGKDDLLTEHMKYVYGQVQRVYAGDQQDNFMASLQMNRKILQLIQQ